MNQTIWNIKRHFVFQVLQFGVDGGGRGSEGPAGFKKITVISIERLHICTELMLKAHVIYNKTKEKTTTEKKKLVQWKVYIYICIYMYTYIYIYKYIYIYRLICPVGCVFANDPGDLGSIPGHVIPKTLKMVLDTSLLNTQQYKARIKGKVE